MCERDSCLESALCYQRHPHSAEELSSRGYWENINNCSSSNEVLTATNMELLSYVQATTNNSMANSIASHVELDVVNCSTTSSSNLSVSSSSGNTSSTSSVPQSSSSIGVNLRVTGQCSQGGRKYMEDFFSVAYQQSENAKDLEYAFVGIYDGHGGAEAATFAKEHLMMEIINQKIFWSDSDQDVLRAIREGYIATHYAMWRNQESWPKTATGLPSTAGTTATIAFIRREKIYIGHVGDSGIVLGYQNENEKFWRAKPLTTDHKPESLEERTRITRSGGKVIVKSGVPRVVWNRPRIGHKGPIRRSTPVDEIPFLAVARSLGDLWSYNSERNEFVVSPDPDVKVIKINPNTFRCLIFGTDGLWNVVTSQEAVDCVYENETLNERLHAQRGESPDEGSQEQWTNPSKGLVEKALRTWSAKKMRADNTSVVTVILYPPGSNIDDSTPSCQTQSYGLEYTQVNGEMLTHDDATTYTELANKYLPPEEYRNFKYDDDVAPELAVDPLQNHYAAYASQEYASFQSAGHDYYNPLSAPQPTCEEVADDEPAAEDDEDQDDEEEENAQESDDDDDTDTDTELLATYAASDCNQEMLAKQTLQMHSKLLDQESLDYMNSFAESYTDSLLNKNMEEIIIDTSANSSKTLLHVSDSSCSDSTSSSNSSSYHSSILQYNQSQQQELLMQHQQYQAQCMSQEEGYSLTKLETRGEQQMRNVTTTTSNSNSSNVTAAAKEVQTFKIFQQNTATATDAFTEATEPTPVNESAEASFFLRSSATSIREPVWDPRFPALCRFINSYVPPKLELNSLLQQEMEEEQQVAMERMELQRCAEQQLYQAQHSISQEQDVATGADLLEEELITSESNDSHTEASDSDPDATIQIHEISSSIASPAAYEEVQDMEVDYTSENEIKLEKQRQRLRRGKSSIEFAEKNEIQRAKSECMFENKPSTSNSAPSLILTPPSTLRSKLPRAKSNYSSAAKQPTKALINPSPSKRTHYPNVPNENQRMTAVSSSRSLRHCNSSPYGSLLQQRAEIRQLRSMEPPLVVDYAKRTLRSRNSLSKDMKAKSTLNLRRSTSMNSQYLRTTASTLLSSKAPQQQSPQQQQQLNMAKPTTPRPAVSHLPIAVRSSKSAAATSTTPAHAINLRSRQVLPLAPTTVNAVSVTSSSSAHHMQQRRERRNLRSLSSRSTTATARLSCREPNCSITYSKATRLQSTAANLAAPPPSPKLISAATRARSLLAPNPSPVAADYSKRSTLRSGALNNTSEPPMLQTRSRVQKRLNR